MPPAANGTLKFTLDNAGRVAGYPLWASETMMRLGYALSEELRAVQAQPDLVSSGNCALTGTWRRTFDDNDSNQALSAGDIVTVTYTTCNREPLARSADGTASLRLLGVDPNGDFRAEVALPLPGMVVSSVVGTPGASDFRVSGLAQIEVRHDDLQNGLVVGGGAKDSILFDFPGLAYAGDRIQAFRFEKTQRWDEARTHLSLHMHYDSPELGGSFEVSTPVALTAWLDSMPEPRGDQGDVQMLGKAGDLVKVFVAGAGGAAVELGVVLDQAGDGLIEGRGEGRWSDAGLTTGFFFADYTPGGRGNAFAYDHNEFTLRAPFAARYDLPVGSVLSVQFTRPPADGQTLHWRLVDRGALMNASTAASDVPIQVEPHGALVIIKPSTALRYSRRYQLVLETGAPPGTAQEVRATTGATLSLRGAVAEFQTPDYLTNVIAFNGPGMLLTPASDAQLSTFPQREGAPPVSYLWTQLSGPPLTIDQPTQRQTAVRLAGAGHGIGSAMVQLTMSLADGTSESTTRAVRTVHDLTDTWVSSLHVPGLYTMDPERHVLGGPAVGTLSVTAEQGRLQIRYVDTAGPGDYFSDWSVDLRSADGQALVPGLYVNAWGSHSLGRPDGVPGLDFNYQFNDFAPFGSEFRILELATDPAGQVVRLAVDFTVNGIGSFTPSRGSVRFNSAVNLTP